MQKNVYEEPEFRWQDKQKEEIMIKWSEAIEDFVICLNNWELLVRAGEQALNQNKTTIQDYSHYLKTQFGEQVRETFETYHSFCNKSLVVWSQIKNYLKSLSPKERAKFSERVRNLRKITTEYEEAIEVFDQLGEYIAQYMPEKPDTIEREMRISNK